MARTKDRARLEPWQAIKTAANIETSTGVQAGAMSRTLLFRTATYARLSVDSAVTESNSITSQQMLMRDFIKDRDEFILVREYKDDGVSGTRFDRQAFDSLLDEVRKGNINCVIVKDFSRFGRDHIEVGNYLEKVFPFLGVRFISVNDGYDSFDRECADKKLAVILKNLVNEYVAKDTSVKVASSYVTKQENGEYDGGRAPYGYVFADERKTRFVVDERPAEVIRDIFAWAMQGDSALAIVKRLTEKNINPPKAYLDTGDFFRKKGERHYWNEFTVNTILQNMAYAGHMALHKWKESKADGISPYRLDETEWKITRNTHEAIITEHDFSLVQEIMRARRVRHRSLNVLDENIIRPDNLLKGKVFCGDCLVPASRMGTNYQRKSGKIRIYRYRCRTYREKGKKECTSKSISEKELEAIVYQAVMTFIWQVECLDDMISRFHSEFFQKMQRSIEKEKGMAERAIRQGKNEKILLYKEYSRRERGTEYSVKSDRISDAGNRIPGYDAELNAKSFRISDVGNGISKCDTEYHAKSDARYDRIEHVCRDEHTTRYKEWYLEEKQKKENEIRYHEERKAQLEEKTAFFERLEKEQAGWIKEILSYKDIVSDEKELTAQIASIFVDKIFLYDGKRVEVVLNFKDEYESLYSHMGQVWGTEEGKR